MTQTDEPAWSAPIQPWDDEAMSRALLDLVATLPRYPLPDVATHGPNLPGAYLHWISCDRDDVTAVLSPALYTATYPVYAGLASTSVKARQGRYRQSLAGIRAITEDDIWVTAIPCATTASAAFAEMVLLDAYRPVLSALGG